jgi:iron only hydrogenase large subunit-like protein
VEAKYHEDAIDFVMTYEELQCILEGAEINLEVPVETEYQTTATAGGIGFPLNRGVQSSVKVVLDKEGLPAVTMEYADGLRNCHDKLNQVRKGDLALEYFEGMACPNGCVDGPGTLAQQGLARVLLTKFAKAAPRQVSDENPEAVEAVRKYDFEVSSGS